MKLSKRCEYGLKAAVSLAAHFGRGYLQSREIAESEGLPAKFLESILLALRSAGLLESKVGAGGGYRLSRTPDAIMVADIISALEGGDPDIALSKEHAQTPAYWAMRMLEERIESALDEAFGSLSIRDLLGLAEWRSRSSLQSASAG